MLNRLPAIPNPERDPLSLQLNKSIGWRIDYFNHVDVWPGQDGLSVLPVQEQWQFLGSEDGSMGGLKLPRNMAYADDGILYLLDKDTIYVFDNCDCQFVQVICLAGTGSAARQVLNAKSIAVGDSKFYIVDTGNRRVLVLSRIGWALRGYLLPPRDALNSDWEPNSIAIDYQGIVYISDPANGLIHRFNWAGRWLSPLEGFGNVSDIAFDTENSLHSIIKEEQRRLYITDEKNLSHGPYSYVHELDASFKQLPVTIYPDKGIELGSLCNQADAVYFDFAGKRISARDLPLVRRYQANGCIISSALDSHIYDCQWHRVLIHCTIPNGCSLRIDTHSSATEKSIEQIRNLDDFEWDTRQSAKAMGKGEWDCLIRSTPGRYLWLRIAFMTNQLASPEIESITLEFPRVSLRRYLPAVYSQDPLSADFLDRFLALFDTTLRSIEDQLKNFSNYLDVDSAPSETGRDFLSWLGSWIGMGETRGWSEEKRRRFIRESSALFCLRGTRSGLQRQLLLFLGIDEAPACCTAAEKSCRSVQESCCELPEKACRGQVPELILEHFQVRRWLWLGEARLGASAVIWGKSIVNRSQLGTNAQAGQSQIKSFDDPLRDPFHVDAHRFTVFLPASLKQNRQEQFSVEALIDAEKPAHTSATIEYVEPRFRIGVQSTIGFNAVVGKYPSQFIQLNSEDAQGIKLLGASPLSSRDAPASLGKTTRLG